MEVFDFAVDPALRRWSRAFGVRPEHCTATLSPDELTVTFGRWSLSTDPGNVVAVSVSGPLERLTRSPGRLHAEAVCAAAAELARA